LGEEVKRSFGPENNETNNNSKGPLIEQSESLFADFEDSNHRLNKNISMP
jgi:hypothetical protein